MPHERSSVPITLPRGDGTNAAEGPAAISSRRRCLGPFNVVAEDNGFGNFLHRFAALPALTLQGQVGLLFAETKVALQNAFCPLDELARLELTKQVRIHFLEAGQFDLGSDQKTDGGDQAHLAPFIDVRETMLEIDDAYDAASTHHRHGKESLVTVFWQFVEEAETGVERGLFRNRNRFVVLGDPAGDTFADAEFQAIDHFGMRIAGGAENKVLSFEHINEAGVALHQCGSEVDDAI